MFALGTAIDPLQGLTKVLKRVLVKLAEDLVLDIDDHIVAGLQQEVSFLSKADGEEPSILGVGFTKDQSSLVQLGKNDLWSGV